ncbi:MAG: ABC transporter ATP-binding protein [Spirochaetae bacterium HGW-Spirochaetae-8]|jgi:simple sugar transport system ATP-binding protein|nr:MAG: ABC transporter ATP-binding protein [Spirochaetae bacterium HGW-Spirochaetae-8]
MSENTILLKMQNITKRFPGVLANDHVDIECQKGQVLGLLGENGAGKTTLMNILYGLFQPDQGQIFVDGKEVVIKSPSEAINCGIGMVHQHFKLVDTLTVIENVILGIPTNKAVLDFGPAKEKLKKLCEEYELYVDPDAVVWRLPVGQQQWVEILKALYRDCKVLVLDEPTAVLTPSESDQLCRAIRRITAQGRSVVFISHKLREVIEITDKVTVIRDGKVIGTVDTKEATQAKLAEMMVGRPVTIERKARLKQPKQTPVLVMKGVNAFDDRGVQALKDFTLTVHAGEIVGVAGVDGNGQRELAECITGLRKTSSGSITIKDTPVTGVISDPSFVGFIPEDRQKTGLVLDFTVAENLLIKDYTKEPYVKKGILQYPAIKKHATELIKKYNVKAPSGDVKVKTLSGGNQQKVVIARELDAQPVLDVASHPTRGLDLGAVASVHDILLRERERGAAVLFISAELQEVMALSDRIIVLYSGQIMGDLDGETASQSTIGQLMLGQRMEAKHE